MLTRHRRQALLACTTTLAISVATVAFAQSATTQAKPEEKKVEETRKGETYLSPIVAKGSRTADPYAKAGLFANVEIRPWNWVINNPDAA